jgi:NAD+ synthase (glutamine-hydrolysing)
MGKNSKRNRVFAEHARQQKTPIIYVNNVGIQNNGKTVYTFDGNSCIYDKKGNIQNQFDPFSEADATTFLNLDETFTHSDDQEDSIETVYESITYGMKLFMEQCGIERVVIGASGGIDSAIVAALMADVLDDPKNLYLVNMPSEFNSQTTKDLAKELADNIGCNYAIIPIGDSIALTQGQLDSNGFHVNQLTFENIQARDRSSRVLAAVAASVGGVFTCNANKSEATVGYTTLYGDLGGFLAPIIDLWKTEVYELANYINMGTVVIPQGIIDIIPSAELSNDQSVDEGKGDPIIYEYHDLLFKSWVERWNRATPADILDWAIRNSLDDELGIDDFDLEGYIPIIDKHFNGDKKAFVLDLERWWNLYDGFAYAKRIQAPPVLAVSRRAFGFDHRESQTKPFYSKRYQELRRKFLGEDLSLREIYEDMKKMGDRLVFGMASRAGLDMTRYNTKELAVKGMMIKLYDCKHSDMEEWE